MAGTIAVIGVVGAPSSHAADSSPLTVNVKEMTIGRALTLNATVKQPFAVAAFAPSNGIVTSLSTTGTVNAGDTLYTVNGHPVVAASGAFPFYRPLRQGDSGQDVDQLRLLLRSKGYDVDPAGPYSSAVAIAVRAWQKSLNVDPTGSIELGDVIAIPDLPKPLRFADGIVVGASIGAGAPLALTQSGERTFTMVLNPDQSALVSDDSQIVLKPQGAEWPARVADRRTDDNGNVILTLTASDGSSVCHSECSALPPRDELTISSQVTIVPQKTGPAVPVAAVRQSPSGDTYVVTATGKHVVVHVVASDGGFAVVDGLRDRTKIRVFDAQKSG